MAAKHVALCVLVTVGIGGAGAGAADAAPVDDVRVLEDASALCAQVRDAAARSARDLAAGGARVPAGADRDAVLTAAAGFEKLVEAVRPTCVTLAADWSWSADNIDAIVLCEVGEGGSECDDLIPDLTRRARAAATASVDLQRRKDAMLVEVTRMVAILDRYPDDDATATVDASPTEPAPPEPSPPEPSPTEVAAVAEPAAPAAPTTVHDAPRDRGPSLAERLAPLKPHSIVLGLGHATGAMPEQGTYAVAGAIGRRTWRDEPGWAWGYEARGEVTPSWGHATARVNLGLAFIGCVCAVVGVDVAAGESGPELPATAVVGGKLDLLLPVGEVIGFELGGQMVWRLGEVERESDLAVAMLLRVEETRAWSIGFTRTSIGEASLWTLTLGRLSIDLSE